MEKISVIIPVYNTPLLKFHKCLESFSKQYFRDFEVIIVDDGSTCPYLNVVEDFKGLIPQIQVIRQKNRGVSAARNLGLAKAEGEFIVFCDADDFVEPDYLENLMDAIKGFDLVICGVMEQVYPCISSEISMKEFKSRPSEYTGLQYINFCWNKLYRKSIIDQFKIQFDEDVKLGEDALFLNKYFRYTDKINILNKTLYHYVRDDHSAVHRYNPKFWEWESRVIKLQYQFFNSVGLDLQELKFLQRWLFLKLKNVVNYYIDKTNGLGLSIDYLRGVHNSDLFTSLYSMFPYSNNDKLTSIDKMFLNLWSHLGIYGMISGRYLTKFLKK